MGDIVEFDSSNLAARIKKDLDENKKFKETIEKYWKRLGYTIVVEIKFNPVNKVYMLRTPDLHNGVPSGKGTARCRKALMSFDT